VLFAFAVSVPIVWFAHAQQERAKAQLLQLQDEALAVRWMAATDRYVNVLESPAAPGVRDAAAAGQQTALQQSSEALGTQVPAALAATARIREAARLLDRAPGGAGFAALEQSAGSGLDDVSDASYLSYESHVVLADLGDSLDNSYFRLFAPLETAGATMAGAIARGEVSAHERILVAGQLALARGFAAALANDLDGAFAADPGLGASLDVPWQHALAASNALASDLDRMLVAKPGAGAAARLARERSALRNATSAFTDLLLARSAREIDRLQGETQDGITMSGLLAASSIVAVFLLAAWTGALIARRDRRELERLRSEARTLAAELGRREAERARVLTEARFDAVFDRSAMGIALLDERGTVVESNPALLEMLGKETAALVPPDESRFAQLLEGRIATFHFEAELTSAAGLPCCTHITISSLDVPRSEAVVAIAIVENVTERKAFDDHLRHVAVHDHLTSLPNHAQFVRRLDAVLGDPAAASEHAVLFIDLDRFKLVNDMLGHHAGDRALVIAGERLRAATRATDLVARLHGDEFAILAADVHNASEARATAERIRRDLFAPLTIETQPVSLSASIGIVDDLTRYASAEQVLRDADIAMYDAKKLGRAHSVIFNAETHERVLAQMQMMADLPIALARDEFRLAFQPIVELESGRVRGFEALMRWPSPTLGIVPPTDFIPVAEESDAICTLGRFALEESCSMLRKLDALGFTGLRANVNLSVAQLAKTDVASDVRSALAAHGIDPSRLTLEITESGLLESKARATTVLGELRRLGVKICVDDFGTGYSSLRYLHELPIDVLKIDRSFVASANGSIGNEPIVQMLLTLARHLGVDAVAEGVETESQRLALVERSCGTAQGFLFAKPLFEEQLVAWLEAKSAGSSKSVA